MAIINTINFLPEVFRSSTNERFLGATMDQLVNDAYNVPVNGYIGRTFAPTYKLGDNYVPESTLERIYYQLEPGVVVKDQNKKVKFSSNYIELLQNIRNIGGTTSNQQRLFKSEYYNYDGHFDYDKFVNYNKYYWIPGGPDAVNVTSADAPYQANYVVTRNTNVGGYTFSTLGGHANTQVTLVRGGTYTFTLNQPGFNFWIQTEAGTSGVSQNIPTISTRDVLGVTNNGASTGVIRFTVPMADSQDFYTGMTIAANVDAAVTLNYNQIQNQLLSEFLSQNPMGIDGINTLLQNKQIIFINNNIDDSYWTTPADPLAGTLNENPVAGVIDKTSRSKTWKIQLIPYGDDSVIQLIPTTNVSALEKVFVKSGLTYASRYFWLNKNYFYALQPTISATSDYLFYQDGTNASFNGEIKLVDNVASPINITKDILGKSGYTSPNGVIFTNGLKIRFDSLVVPSSYANNEFYVDGVGTSITLTPVSQLIVPESFSNLLSNPDYITINRSSLDRNPWSRSNNWFHVDVLQATADYNQTVIDYGPNITARRPIIEFEPNLRLFNYGVSSKDHVDLITFDSTDAFSDIEGQISYTLDGVELVTGMRVVFANDIDDVVKVNIWEVNIEIINSQRFIRFVMTDDSPVLPGETVLADQGSYAGNTYYFDGSNWNLCQSKTALNQEPLFDVFDADGYSFADTTVYPESTFAGTKIFGYAHGTGTKDVVLGFPLVYRNFNNIGDIVFDNYFDTETFTYNNGTEITINVDAGYLQNNTSLTTNVLLGNWVTGVEDSKQYQTITRFYNGQTVKIGTTDYAYIQIDILPAEQVSVPTIKVFVNNQLLNQQTDYAIMSYGIYYVVAFVNAPTVGDKIDIKIFNNTTSKFGYYDVPKNLDYNPLNSDFSSITLGQLRTHYNQLIENTSLNSIPLRDSYLKAQGGTILQQSSPVIYSMVMLNDPTVNFLNGISFARKEYTKFKNKFLSLCSSLKNIDYTNPKAGVDTILASINAIKNSSFPWYYSDMVPQGPGYSTITYRVLNARQTQYEISSMFDDTTLSNRAVLVYLNGKQLLKDTDYVFSELTPAVTLNVELAVGDIINIYDYANTDGNYIPETPTKLGLYPKFDPKIYLDTSYQTPINVIQGHDGSITPAFGDFRDDFLLELELRIYNNIKANYNTNQINVYDTIPGRFRATDYTREEWVQLLSSNFLNWVGTSGTNYTDNQWFDSNNQWTWNYGKSIDSLDGSSLQGYWRSIYEYWFDTDVPHLAPWRMLGIGDEPSWWVERYGPAPYTAGNETLVQDLAAGYIWNGSDAAAYYDARFARPGLTQIKPVDSSGNLLPPYSIGIVGKLGQNSIGDNFSVGQWGPTETAWRRSSDFPYALQAALATARPAEYFATQLDTSRFYNNPVTQQFSTVNNKKIAPSRLVVNGDTVTNPGTVLRSSGYLNWVADHIKSTGVDPVQYLNDYFSGLNAQLVYKVAGFTDQNLISVSAEQTSPGSTNASVVIPDNNYSAYIGNPVPVRTVAYSAVIVEITDTGYAVTGYDVTNPFFTIIPSIANNNASTITVGNVSARIYQDSAEDVMYVPYGTTFATVQQVVDFLISYERSLLANGFIFNSFDNDLQATRNWTLSAQEFLYWSQQGWNPGTIVVLSPVYNQLQLVSNNTVVDEITNISSGSKLLNQTYGVIKNNEFTVVRTNSKTGNRCTITTVNQAAIAFAKLNLIQFESILIFDNVDDFGDIVYIPELGTRQYRLKLVGSKTGIWTGAMNPQGYIYSNPNIPEWMPDSDYRMGCLVVYNGNYYTAPMDISASDKFNSTNWQIVSPSDVQTGLLKSFGTNAKLFIDMYDVDHPLPDKTLQAFSGGLIGFRERSYLTDLGIDIANQTKFYQGYITQKGTPNAIEALTKATFNVVNSTISTFEEWAVRVGQYGDVRGNQFTEFVLDESEFLNSPVAFTVANTYSAGNLIVNLAINSNLALSNVYNSSNLSNTSTSLYANRSHDTYSTDLPTVGYVNVNDVDYQVFDITKISNIEKATIGKKVWVAKDNDGNWDVYRINETGGLQGIALTYSLDSYATLTFDEAHGLNVNDYFLLTNFDSYFDGLYRVVEVLNSTNVTIEIENVNRLIQMNSRVTGSGTVYFLKSMVLSTFDLIDSIRPTPNWIVGDKVWIDNTEAGGWGVYTYQRPWVAKESVIVQSTTVNSGNRFGNVVALSTDEKWVYIAEPGANNVQVYANVNYSYELASNISNVAGGFGSSITTSGNVVIIGAPTAANVNVYINNNGTHTRIQTIGSTSANKNFGATVKLSRDQHWLYISEPLSGKVYAYWSANVDSTAHYTSVATISGNSAYGFGTAIETTSNGNVLIVSSPKATVNGIVGAGNVSVYRVISNVFTLTQTITSRHLNINAYYGSSLAINDVNYTSMSNDLFVSAPGSTATGVPTGIIERLILNSSGSQFDFNSNIMLPNLLTGSFGTSMSVTADGQVLAVGTKGAATEEGTVFDNGKTTIDNNGTTFIESVFNSGAVYMFEPTTGGAISGIPHPYSYTEIISAAVESGDQFGYSVAAGRGTLVVGSPGTSHDAGDVHIYDNATQSTAWQLTRQQQPKVDITGITRTFIYNKSDNIILSALDFVDPAKGKVLNAVGVDIDYQRVNDPAIYNSGVGSSATDFYWGPKQVGKIWWNLDTVRYIDYEQDSLSYRLSNWGKQFDGSSIDIYEWVESPVLPSQYTTVVNDGVPLHADDSVYSTYGYVTQNGVINVKYYFWVTGKTSIATNKQNSVYSITAAIENPQSQNISYVNVLRDDTVALYNVNNYLVGKNSVVHLGTRTIDSGVVHSEYALVQEGNPKSQIPESILNKLTDSLVGQDRVGNPVPDPELLPSQAYGIDIRPRQSMFVNRLLALENYISLANQLMMLYPVTEQKIFTGLYSSEPVPGSDSGQYQQTLPLYEQLGFIRTTELPTGYSILVETDSNYNNKWAIYTWDGSSWAVSRVQSYKTDATDANGVGLYWHFIDWNATDYNPTTTIDVVVADNVEFGKLQLRANTYIKVLNNGAGQYVVYFIDDTLTSNLVSIENGTIQISTNSIPPLELRSILTSVQTQIFVDDLAIDFNRIFFAMIKYALSEQKNIEWVFKTSFISSTQYIRQLQEFPSWIADNQQYYLEYINEVKPYRTVVREFVVDYQGSDEFSGDATDFDLPPKWDANISIYRSPNGEQPYDSTELETYGEYHQWNSNHLYQVVDFIIGNPGTGYISPPQVIISGGNGTGATATATINGTGGIASVNVVDPGKNFLSTPKVTINGTGSGAVVYPVLRAVYDGNNQGHNLVRSIQTSIKFDRVSYTTSNTFVFWSNVTTANVDQTFTANAIINFRDQLYHLDTDYTITANDDVVFPINNCTPISSSYFNNANDRIAANNYDVNLALTQTGIDYPGVVVDGNTFVGNVHDTVVESFYSNVLGINPSDIIIDGGPYVSTYSSHAPEELVPGRTYDNLNLTVYDTSKMSFRILEDMNNNYDFYRIASANIATLAANLHSTDTSIIVNDATVLPPGNPELAIPGVVVINGEIITYYRNYSYETPVDWAANLIVATSTLINYNSNLYVTTGNVFDVNGTFANIAANVQSVTANTLTNIQRGVVGTYTPNLHVTGSRVVDSSEQQKIPNTTVANVQLTSNVTYVSTDNVSYGLRLTENITANVGDIITQYVQSSSELSGEFRVIGNVTNSNSVAVIITAGGIAAIQDVFDNPLGFDISAFDSVTGVIYINGNPTTARVISGYTLGLVNDSGEYTVPAGSYVHTTNCWYNPGLLTPSDGVTLSATSTSQARFLQNSPGFTPTAGVTP